MFKVVQGSALYFLQADALNTWLCCLIHKLTHTHNHISSPHCMAHNTKTNTKTLLQVDVLTTQVLEKITPIDYTTSQMIVVLCL